MAADDNSLLGILGKSFGWFGASLTGLTALCYGSGYFLLHAHLTMLGFSDAVNMPMGQYLIEGGRFFYFTLWNLIWLSLAICIVLGVLWVLVLSVYRIGAVKAGLGNLRTALQRKVPNHGRIGGFAVSALVIAFISLHTTWCYLPAAQLLDLSDLAFKPSASTNGPGFSSDVGRAILAGSDVSRGQLIATYVYSFLPKYLLMLIVTAAVFNVPLEKPYSTIVRTLLLAYAALLTVLLPIVFGILVRAPIYPVVNVAIKDGQPTSGALVEQSQDRILVWHPEVRRVTWIPISQVSSIEFLGESDLFALGRSDHGK